MKLLLLMLTLLSCSHNANKNLEKTSEFNRLPSSENSQSCFKNICIGDEVYDVSGENTGFSGKVTEIIPSYDPQYTKFRVVNKNERAVTFHHSWVHKLTETQGCWSNTSNEDFCIDQIVTVFSPKYNSSRNSFEKAKIIEIPSKFKSTFLLQEIDKKFTMLLEPGAFFDMTKGRCRSEAPSFCIGSEYDNGLNSKDTVLGINESKYGEKGLIYLVKPGDNPKELIYISHANMLKRFKGDYSVPKGSIKIVYVGFGEKFSTSNRKKYISWAKERLLHEAQDQCKSAFVESYGLGVPDLNKSPIPETMKCNYVPGGPAFSLGTMFFDPNIKMRISKVECKEFSWEVWCTHPLAEK